MKEDELQHFGVLGMKWGKRSARPLTPKEIAKLEKKTEKSIARASNKASKLAASHYVKIYNAMADESVAIYAKINSKPQYKNLDLVNKPNSALSKKYYKECVDAVTESLQRNSNRILGNKIDPRVKVTWSSSIDGFPTFYVERVQDTSSVQHSENVNEKIKLDLKFDQFGRILSFSFPEDIFYEETDELQHYGVLGMKWGRRLARKPASSDHLAVKAIRKKRLAKMTDEELKIISTRMRLVKDFKDSNRHRTVRGRISTMSNAQLRANIDRAKLANAGWRYGLRSKKLIKDMTDAEVKKSLARFNMEKSYKDLRKEELLPAKRLISLLLTYSMDTSGRQN